jgi:predicted molibdopterin-dependent oxidoreductase YjgC
MSGEFTIIDARRMKMPRSDMRFGADPRRAKTVQIEVDGEYMDAFEGETIAAALLTAGKRVLNTTRRGSTRGIYCGMGLCQGCLMTVDGVTNVLACQTLVKPGIKIETQQGCGHLMEELRDEER